MRGEKEKKQYDEVRDLVHSRNKAERSNKKMVTNTGQKISACITLLESSQGEVTVKRQTALFAVAPVFQKMATESLSQRVSSAICSKAPELLRSGRGT